MSYHHLTIEERYQIKAYKEAGYKNHEIAKEINIHPSTIGRELKRNSGERTGTYIPIWADNYAKDRKITQSKNANKKLTKELEILIEEYLKKDWSPEQISGVLMSKHNIYISYVSIYRFIYQEKVNGGELYRHLRHSNKKRVKYGTKYQGKIKDRVSISKRPKIVDDKSRIGDFEADTIIGSGQKGAIITIVDRKSMYLKMSTPGTKKADETAKKISKLLIPFKDKIHTITTDNGFEFSDHKKISKSLNCDYYFYHPYSSWERGLNENINGLIRQYIPKGSSFKNITKKDIRTIEDKLNHRPRKSLNWRTPYEVFYDIKIAS